MRGRIGPPSASCVGRGEQRGEPPRPDLDVVVEQADQVARGVGDAGVAGDVDALRGAERDVDAAVGSTSARVGASSASSSTTTISAPCSAACGATEASATAR